VLGFFDISIKVISGHFGIHGKMPTGFGTVYYNNQINLRTLIGQSVMGYCASNVMKKLPVF